jgi:arylsulfatase A-like enzyme
MNPQREKHLMALRSYYAQIANLDDNVGRMMTALEETGQLDDTIVIYFSDHGDLMGSHGMTGKSRPEEESSNIPLLIRYPRLVPQGLVSDAYISGVDLMPTLLGLIGVDIPHGVEGSNLGETVMGKRMEGADSVLLQYEHSRFPTTMDAAFRSILVDNWSYTCFAKGPATMFHLPDDPYQLDNLIDDPHFAEIRLSLHKRRRILIKIAGKVRCAC